MLLDRFPSARQELPRGEPLVPLPFAGRENDRKDDQSLLAAAGQERAHLDAGAVAGVEEALAHQNQSDIRAAQAFLDLFVPERPALELLIGPEFDAFLRLQAAEKADERIVAKVLRIAMAVADENPHWDHGLCPELSLRTGAMVLD
jgi:hypothetical protein